MRGLRLRKRANITRLALKKRLKKAGNAIKKPVMQASAAIKRLRALREADGTLRLINRKLASGRLSLGDRQNLRTQKEYWQSRVKNLSQK